jgi:hypothetical protein
MVVLRLDDNEHAFLILDDQGRPIGRVHHTAYPLDLLPPEDTVFLDPEPPAAA